MERVMPSAIVFLPDFKKMAKDKACKKKQKTD